LRLACRVLGVPTPRGRWPPSPLPAAPSLSQAARKREQEERAVAEERAREKSQRSYKLLQVDEKKESNKDIDRNFDEFEDDFM